MYFLHQDPPSGLIALGFPINICYKIPDCSRVFRHFRNTKDSLPAQDTVAHCRWTDGQPCIWTANPKWPPAHAYSTYTAYLNTCTTWGHATPHKDRIPNLQKCLNMSNTNPRQETRTYSARWLVIYACPEMLELT